MRYILTMWDVNETNILACVKEWASYILTMWDVNHTVDIVEDGKHLELYINYVGCKCCLVPHFFHNSIVIY